MMGRQNGSPYVVVIGGNDGGGNGNGGLLVVLVLALVVVIGAWAIREGVLRVDLSGPLTRWAAPGRVEQQGPQESRPKPQATPEPQAANQPRVEQQTAELRQFFAESHSSLGQLDQIAQSRLTSLGSLVKLNRLSVPEARQEQHTLEGARIRLVEMQTQAFQTFNELAELNAADQAAAKRALWAHYQTALELHRQLSRVSVGDNAVPPAPRWLLPLDQAAPNAAPMTLRAANNEPQ